MYGLGKLYTLMRKAYNYYNLRAKILNVGQIRPILQTNVRWIVGMYKLDDLLMLLLASFDGEFHQVVHNVHYPLLCSVCNSLITITLAIAVPDVFCIWWCNCNVWCHICNERICNQHKPSTLISICNLLINFLHSFRLLFYSWWCYSPLSCNRYYHS